VKFVSNETRQVTAHSIAAPGSGLVRESVIYRLPTAKGWGREYAVRPTAVWEEREKLKTES
jgi:hypothetical protein